MNLLIFERPYRSFAILSRYFLSTLLSGARRAVECGRIQHVVVAVSHIEVLPCIAADLPSAARAMRSISPAGYSRVDPCGQPSVVAVSHFEVKP